MKLFIGILCLVSATVQLGPSLGATQLGETYAVTVIADSQVQRVSSSAQTVGELLAELGLTLDKLDRASLSLSTPLSEDAIVQVTRVKFHQVVEEVPIAAKTTVLGTPKLAAGFTKILSHGQEGLVKRVVSVWEKDGQVTQRGVQSEKVLVPVKDTVVLRGTRDEPNRGGNWHTPRSMEATGYVAFRCGGSPSGRTATGPMAVKGLVAVDPRNIPLGTKLYIPGYGFALAADTGGAIKGNRIDLCFDTYQEAINFGRRMIDVYVLK